jgi:putative transposase
MRRSEIGCLKQSNEKMSRSTTFFKKTINNNGFPHKVVADKSGANYVALENINLSLILPGLISFIEICQLKYLNNMVEQDHRSIKKITRPRMGSKHFIQRNGLSMALKVRHDSKKRLPEDNISAYKSSWR